MIDQECAKGSDGSNQPGDLTRGNSLTLTIRPDLHTGHMHGLNPVSLVNRSSLVSDGSFCFIIASMSEFTFDVN